MSENEIDVTIDELLKKKFHVALQGELPEPVYISYTRTLRQEIKQALLSNQSAEVGMEFSEACDKLAKCIIRDELSDPGGAIQTFCVKIEEDESPRMALALAKSAEDIE